MRVQFEKLDDFQKAVKGFQQVFMRVVEMEPIPGWRTVSLQLTASREGGDLFTYFEFVGRAHNTSQPQQEELEKKVKESSEKFIADWSRAVPGTPITRGMVEL